MVQSRLKKVVVTKPTVLLNKSTKKSAAILPIVRKDTPKPSIKFLQVFGDDNNNNATEVITDTDDDLDSSVTIVHQIPRVPFFFLGKCCKESTY